MSDSKTEITQDDIFKFYVEMGHGSDYKHTGVFNVRELSRKYNRFHVIEMLIAMNSGAVEWDFGHWRNISKQLIEVYGADLAPILLNRMRNPYHGGGEARGEAYLEASRKRAYDFCEQTLLGLVDFLQNRPIAVYENANEKAK